MNCPICNSTNLTVMATMTVSMPVDMYCKMTKAGMRRKDFQIWGVNWDMASFICKNCGYTLGGRREHE